MTEKFEKGKNIEVHSTSIADCVAESLIEKALVAYMNAMGTPDEGRMREQYVWAMNKAHDKVLESIKRQ